MSVKKIARPINKAKNIFLEWLNQNNADNIDVFIGDKTTDWDYYRHVSAFVKNRYYSVVFMLYYGEAKIRYKDEENEYDKLTNDEFLQLIK